MELSPHSVDAAVETNGIAYAVMMTTPLDIEDFVTGFLMAEGLAQAAEIGPVAVHAVENDEWGTGYVARVNLPEARLGPILERARRRIGDSSCGICGIEGVEAALRPLPKLARPVKVTPEAIRLGLGALRARQQLGRETSATHAAAFCRTDGAVHSLREDVGRHNALDKLIGALLRGGIDPATGVCLITSRCSYEMVQKAVVTGFPILAAVSAPTLMARRLAEAHNLTLIALARHDSAVLVSHPERVY